MGSEEIIENNKEVEHRGLILSKGIKSAIIMTSKGEFIKVKAGKDNKIGEDYISKESFTFKKYKLQISILLSIILVIFTIGIFQYRSLDKTIVVETTSEITLEVNKFNKVINSYTATEKGNIMLNKLDLNNLDIDYAVMGILNYAINNEMVPDTGILITITGKALGYNDLEETEKFIEEQGLQVKLNNSGQENKVSY